MSTKTNESSDAKEVAKLMKMVDETLLMVAKEPQNFGVKTSSTGTGTIGTGTIKHNGETK